MNNSLIVENLNIAELNDDELAERLKDLGFHPGPILSTTRSVYERKLARLMRNESFNDTEEFEDEIVDAEVRPTPIMSSTFREYTPNTSFASIANFTPSPPTDYDDLRRRPLHRLGDSTFSTPTSTSTYRPWSAADIVTQATPPPPEPEKPLLSPFVKVAVAGFLLIFMLFVYYNMESTPVNPFTSPSDAVSGDNTFIKND